MRDGIITRNGLVADFRVLRRHRVEEGAFWVETAVGDHYALEEEMTWDAAAQRPGEVQHDHDKPGSADELTLQQARELCNEGVELEVYDAASATWEDSMANEYGWGALDSGSKYRRKLAGGE